MHDKQTTIFRQLILNIIIPALLALVVMAFINFTNTRNLIRKSNDEKNRIISDEITDVLEFQELAMSIIDNNMAGRMEQISDRLIEFYDKSECDIRTTDLKKLGEKMGLNHDTEDIYIIDTTGLIVNTSYQADLGFNLFSIGDEHRKHLEDVFHKGCFVNTRFAIEASTKKPRKYTYHATSDRKYIIELGAYSSDAEDVLNNIENIKSKIIAENSGIVDLEIFFMADTIFSLNSDAVLYNNGEYLYTTFSKHDTSSYSEKKGKIWYNYQYMFMPRDNSALYKGSVVRIVSDRTSEKVLLKYELTKFIILFILTLVVVTILIYRKTKVITSPIKKLVENVDRITGGHLGERADVEGNNEITRLSEKFNMMIDELEKYYNELEEMVKERTAKIEEQKRHIMDSIYYARRIQTAILPSDEYIGSSIKNNFIYYRPKDIVSGDFYWFHRANGNIMIAAVDCTGHGVPGAFMSIVGYNQLNYAVNVMNARSSGEILNQLNRGVIETLTENSHESRVMDGMDLALCVFSEDMTKLEYSGANNPLVIIRDGELLCYKADKFPVGPYQGSLKQVFNTQYFDLRKGDCVYIYSDGYPDQFGGPKDKKLTSRRFRQILQDIHDKPMDKQKEILDIKLKEWMGSSEQVDDILVIGIKV